MNNPFKQCLTTICLFLACIGTSFANPGRSTGLEDKTFPISIKDTPCNEPAPANFQVVEISPFSVKATWNVPVSIPFEYNVKLYKVEGGTLVQNFNIAGTSTEVTVTNLDEKTPYEIVVAPVCSDGTISPNTGNQTFTSGIIDLVVLGYTAPSTINITCGINSLGGYCELNPPGGNVVPFRISNLTGVVVSRDFGVFRPLNCNYYLIKAPTPNNGYTFACDGQYLTISKNNGIVAILSIIIPESSNARRLVALTTFNTEYKIERLVSNIEGYADAYPGSCPGGRNLEVAAPEDLVVSPNPFTNQLEIQLPNTFNEDTKINLYDLQGRCVMPLKYPGDLQTIYLTTEKLTPGMYFLRAEYGGMTQTVKIVKTQ